LDQPFQSLHIPLQQSEFFVQLLCTGKQAVLIFSVVEFLAGVIASPEEYETGCTRPSASSATVPCPKALATAMAARKDSKIPRDMDQPLSHIRPQNEHYSEVPISDVMAITRQSRPPIPQQTTAAGSGVGA
jgi:hypothetical protein